MKPGVWKVMILGACMAAGVYALRLRNAQAPVAAALREARAERDRAEATVSALAHEARRLTDAAAALSNRAVRAEAELEAERLTTVPLREKVKAVLADYARYEGEASKGAEALAASARELQEAQRRLAQLENENASLSRELSQLREADEDRERAVRELEAARQRMRDLEKRVADLTHELAGQREQPVPKR